MSVAVVVGLFLVVAAGVVVALNVRSGAFLRAASEQDGVGRLLLLQALSVAMATGGVLSIYGDLGWWGLALGLGVLLTTASLVVLFLRRRATARR